MPEICPRYTWYLPEICLRFARDLLKICPRYAWDLIRIYPRFAWGFYEVFQRFAWDLPELYQRFASASDKRTMTMSLLELLITAKNKKQHLSIYINIIIISIDDENHVVILAKMACTGTISAIFEVWIVWKFGFKLHFIAKLSPSSSSAGLSKH